MKCPHCGKIMQYIVLELGNHRITHGMIETPISVDIDKGYVCNACGRIYRLKIDLDNTFLKRFKS